MTVNRYMIERLDGSGYRRSTRDECNRLIEMGRAEWEGTDPDGDDVVHYAQRIR